METKPRNEGNLEQIQLTVPVGVTNIEEMQAKLIEMKSESQTISEEESYKFQLSYVTQSPIAKKNPAKLKRETTAKKQLRTLSKSPKIRDGDKLKSKEKRGTAQKRLTSASPLRAPAREQQPWECTLRVLDSSAYGPALSSHQKSSSPGGSSGSFHLRPQQVQK